MLPSLNKVFVVVVVVVVVVEELFAFWYLLSVFCVLIYVQVRFFFTETQRKLGIEIYFHSILNSPIFMAS